MGISTHVLDARTGMPAAGVTVRLSAHTPDGWRDLGSSVTDGDGRVQAWPTPAPAGVARLTFDTGAYLGTETFYPEVSITFRVESEDAHLHVPLLLSPYAYSTYRGS